MLRKCPERIEALAQDIRRFNEAGARMLRKCPFFFDQAVDVFFASMRPEHGCSGNAVIRQIDSVRSEASMRPEHGCSGNVRLMREVKAVIHVLQ